MSFLFGKSDSPPPLPPMPTKSDAEIQEAAEKERLRLTRLKGRQSTILTQGSDLGSGNVLKTLLGGGS